jgi:hypothetical protein
LKGTLFLLTFSEKNTNKVPYWLNPAAVRLIASMMAADPSFPLDFSGRID